MPSSSALGKIYRRERLAAVSCVVVLLLLPIGCRKSSSNANQSAALNAAAEGNQPQSADSVEALRLAVEARDWRRASEVAQAAMIERPNDANVLTNAAIAIANSGNRVEAAQLLVDAAKVANFLPESRVDNAIQALFDVGRVYDVIALLEEVVQQDPSAAKYRRMLVGFLGEVELTEAIAQHMSRLIQDGTFDLPLLRATTETSSRRFSQKTIDTLVRKNPSDLRPLLGQAKTLLGSRDALGSERLLRRILEQHSDFAPAHAMLGLVLITQGKTNEVPRWYSQLPQDAPDYSGYWVTMGEWAFATGQTAVAVRAFAEATRLSANDSGTWARLGNAIRKFQSEQQISGDDGPSATDLDTIAASIDRRNTNLLELREQFTNFDKAEHRSQRIAVEIARALLNLGRVWEAEAWLAVAVRLPEDPTAEVTSLRQDAISRLRQDRDWQSQRNHPELAFDVSKFPLPDYLASGEMPDLGPQDVAGRKPGDPPAESALPIQLIEESKERKLQFYGEVGSGVQGPRVPIYQALGCGGGVIDFDHDGHHDLVFAAAGGTPRQTDSQPGALFRNLNGTFRNVSLPSNFADGGFGQGIVIGDYNDDGFQDIAILNLGRNRLLRNNGDGTFSDASGSLGETGKGEWSTSGAFVDVDGDGFNDLVIVNYCDANQPLNEPCFDKNGNEINCYPLRYRAARDRFLRGQPNGQFIDVTDAWARQPSPGRGLGIVAGRLDGRTQGIYIVNDASKNHFYRWDRQSPDPDADALVDAGVASGLAVDAQSLDQGSMGIASGDIDNDGDLDFYVTGFNREYNIYYEQQTPGFWTDRTAALGMVDGTLGMVGFGTEAIDFDNDGREELFVTNGHIGIFAVGTSPYAQPMQLFRFSDSGFHLTDMSQWDEYLNLPHVGRALFTCDADRNGQTDVIVTHATESVALLMNHSDPSYHSIAFRLADTKRTREAVGATMQFELRDGKGSRRRFLYRLSGDGYLCSNRPELFAGTGSAAKAFDVQVTWPDGELQQIGDLNTDSEYLIVRAQAPFLLQEYDSE